MMRNNGWASNPTTSRDPEPVDRYDRAFEDSEEGEDSWKYA